MKKLLLSIILVAVTTLIPKSSSAQIDPPDDPVDVPFDGGLSLLIAGGTIYGIKKMKDEKKLDRLKRR